jgi:hypothetical protein
MLPDWGVTQFRAELAECDELVDDTDTDPWSIAR